MIDYTEKEGKLAFKVRVSPRASRSEIVGEHDGLLRVRVAAPPVDGAANDELIRTLVRAFNVSRAAVEITVGLGSKLKNVSVTGHTPDLVATLNQLSRANSSDFRR
jgi:uncharacterized protein (TIGR00251 family)